MLRRQGRGGKFLEEVLIVGGLLLVQCVLSGYVVFTDHLLALGADPLAVVVVAGAAYAAFCFPFAVALERYVRSRFPPQHEWMDTIRLHHATYVQEAMAFHGFGDSGGAIPAHCSWRVR